ncbi:hypothetical protein GCM10009107_60650 [Ideonella azotifigens]|uniref:Uncharacterized protein n=1 Tax=Ideonella azotifigens TaxID=513160 RepID=A0ABN1KKK4_9BURK
MDCGSKRGAGTGAGGVAHHQRGRQAQQGLGLEAVLGALGVLHAPFAWLAPGGEPFLGQPERAAAALQQAQAQALFQRHHAARQRGLGPAAGLRGLAETAVLGHQLEVGEGEQVHEPGFRLLPTH